MDFNVVILLVHNKKYAYWKFDHFQPTLHNNVTFKPKHMEDFQLVCYYHILWDSINHYSNNVQIFLESCIIALHLLGEIYSNYYDLSRTIMTTMSFYPCFR